MSKDIEELTKLNKDYVDSVQNSDVERFDEILAAEFYSTLADKTFVDRAAFLKFTAIPVKFKNLTAQDVKIRVMGDFAIIHARTSYITAAGEQAFGRYTDCWAKQNGRWLAVSAHVSRKPADAATSDCQEWPHLGAKRTFGKAPGGEKSGEQLTAVIWRAKKGAYWQLRSCRLLTMLCDAGRYSKCLTWVSAFVFDCSGRVLHEQGTPDDGASTRSASLRGDRRGCCRLGHRGGRRGCSRAREQF